jgi:3-oxoacyl-[acyl-carrier protein] reductase
VKGLAGRVAVITGAGSGIGAGIASVLAQEGATVALLDLDLAAATAVADRLAGAGREAAAYQADVVDGDAVRRVADAVAQRYGRIDILAANAGIYPVATLEQMSDADWDLVMNVNVKGAVHSIQACAPSMRAGGYGRIVLTSSITGPITGQPGLSHYAASKAAMLGLMRTAALEYIGEGITVNAVQPGNVRTGGIAAFSDEFVAMMERSIPIGRLAEPEEIGWAVRFLASEEAGYITGQAIVVDGGQVLPEGGIDPGA